MPYCTLLHNFCASPASNFPFSRYNSTNPYVVGYASGVDSVEQYNFIAVGFQTVGYNTSDIQQIKLRGDNIGWGSETFSVWAGAPAVVEGTDAYVYLDPMMDPLGEAIDHYWGDGDGARANFSFQAGQGVVVQMGAEGIGVQTAGEVPMEPVTLTSVSQYNFLGNPFPQAIDIQNVKIAGGGIGWGTETFSVWAGAPAVVEGSDAYVYLDPMMDPLGEATDYYWGDGDAARATYPIACGQAFVIQVGAPDLEFTITPPYATK